MIDSNIVDLDGKTEDGFNMYGCQPCPKCKSKYRCQFQDKPKIIVCDDCGFEENQANNEE